MNIELVTSTKTAPLEVLDLQVWARGSAGQSRLSVQFICRTNRYADHRYVLPSLSWFDASHLQQFCDELATARHPQTCRADLPDVGLQLTGSVRRLAGRWTAGRTIRVEALPSAAVQFSPFAIYASYPDVRTYGRKLYNQLWEAFTRG